MKRKKTEYIASRALAIVRFYDPKVTKVVDADKPVVVQVTTKDVIKSNIKDHETCALAVACKRSFNADRVIIGLTTSYVIKDKTAYRYHNAGTVSREITSFDRKAGFETGYYQLSPPSPASQLGMHRTGTNTRSPNPKKQRAFRHFTGNVRTVLGRGIQ